MQKKTGRLTGWLGYTLSWTNRQFDEINSGKRYPFKYDRRHDVELVMSYELYEDVNVSATWVYGTGNSITLPIYHYDSPVIYDAQNGGFYTREIESIGDKNSFRMAPYHRLDISLEFYKKKKNYERTWVLGVYNAYNRPNPYFIYDGYTSDGNERAFRQP